MHTNHQRATRAALLAAVLCGASSAAWAQTTPEDRIAALEAQMAAMAAELTALRQETAQARTPAPAPAPQAVASISGGRPRIASPDGDFSATFHGVFQYDVAAYSQNDNLFIGMPAGTRDLNSGGNFRRARLGVDGRIFGNFDYGLLYEFGGSGTDGPGQLWESWIQYNALKIGETAVLMRVGAFAPNLGLEDAASTSGSMFLERPSSADVARSLAGNDQRMGFQLQASGPRWMAAAAITGGRVGDPQTFDEQLSYTARLAATPFRGDGWRVHVGINGSYVARPPQPTPTSPVATVIFQDRPELRVDGTRLVSTGALDSASAFHRGVELAVQAGPLVVQSEVFRYGAERRVPITGTSDPRFSGWYVEGGWMFGGDARRYSTSKAAFDGPAVPRPLDPAKGQWGSWELVARYSVIDLDFDAGTAGAAAPLGSVRGGEQSVIAAGVNWFVNPAVKFALQYQQVEVDRLDVNGAQIGQDFETLALRSQLAF